MEALFKQRIDDFLAQERIAVAGYSSHSNPGNAIYDKLKKNGYQVYAVNPNADKIRGITAYKNLAAIPDQVDGVMITAPPKATEEIVEECGKLGIKRIWIHRSIDNGSYSKKAVQRANELGISVIPAACPMMFVKADVIHKCFKWIMNARGKLKTE